MTIELTIKETELVDPIYAVIVAVTFDFVVWDWTSRLFLFTNVICIAFKPNTEIKISKMLARTSQTKRNVWLQIKYYKCIKFFTVARILSHSMRPAYVVLGM